MAYTAPRTWVAAETLTAALLNTHLRDNMLETAVAKVTTAGDIAYATGANALTRLAVGSLGSVLGSTGTAPRWSSSAVTASGGVAINVQFVNTLTAAANADILEACQIYATIASGTYTGLAAYGLLLSGMAKTGTGTIDNAYGLYITAPTIGTTNWALYGSDGNYRLGGTSSKVFIGDDANANMTAGVTVTAGTADERFTGKLSGFAHGVTTVAETDTVFCATVANSTSGGATFESFRTGAANYALRVRGIIATSDTTKSTVGTGALQLDGALSSGTGRASLGANCNIVVFSDNQTVRFIFDADGDSHEDGTGWTAYDDYDDVALLQALDHSLDKRLNAQAGAWLRENKAALQAARIVTFNDDTDGVPFINKSRLSMLHTGAIRQLSDRLNSALSRLELAERKLALIS